MNQLLAHVLVVEDRADIASLMQRALARAKIKAMIAPTGELGLELVLQHHFDLILLDISLPGISGIEVCRQLKADPRLNLIPIIFVSGETDPACKAEAQRLGAVDFIAKPFDVLTFLSRIMGHLNLSLNGERDKRHGWPLPTP